MPLHWHFEESEHPRFRDDERIYELTEDMHHRLTPMAETLVLLTMPCGMQKITKDTANEFYVRLKLLERLSGCFFRDGKGNETDIEPKHVHAMIGLRVNVPQETRAAFRKRIVDQQLKDWERVYDRAKSELDKERAQELAGQVGLV